jgi:ribonuclease HII
VLPEGGVEGIGGINDSKKLSEAKREAIYAQLVEHPEVK